MDCGSELTFKPHIINKVNFGIGFCIISDTALHLMSDRLTSQLFMLDCANNVYQNASKTNLNVLFYIPLYNA